MYTIKQVITSTNKVMKQYKYKFNNDCEAAKYNSKLLNKNKYDFEQAMVR